MFESKREIKKDMNIQPETKAAGFVSGLNRRDIEAKLANAGDYVKIDYLTRTLKLPLDFDTKKFVQVKLSSLYESRGMYAEAARLIGFSAEINTTFTGKIADFMKACELYIKAGKFMESDEMFNKALICGNERQKVEMKMKRKDFFKMHINDLTKKDKRKHAMEAYEKYITLDLMPEEKRVANNALLDLYQKLGKVREYANLKRGM